MKADKAQVTRLLKTARGQVDGILKMVEEDKYCIDISNQLLACEAILQKTNREVVRAHIESCVLDAFDSGDKAQRDEKINELMSTFAKLQK